MVDKIIRIFRAGDIRETGSVAVFKRPEEDGLAR